MGRAEMAFVLSSIGLSMNVINQEVFSVLIFVTFLMNMLTIVGLKMCAVSLSQKTSSPPAEETH